MRLLYIEIDGYKHLKNVRVQFHPVEEGVLFQDSIPIRFFIGLNGSGKSAFLEGICLLFSRLVQDEAPGFRFRLGYEIRRAGKRLRVEVASGEEGEPFSVRVQTQGREGAETLRSFAGRRELLPDYVVACASGSNNNFFDIVVRTPRDALHGELFDASMLGKSRLDGAQRRAEAERALKSLRLLEENPLCLFVDEENSLLALAAFLAVLPQAGAGGAEGHMACRRKILSMLDSGPVPVSLSFTLDSQRLRELEGTEREWDWLFPEWEGGGTPGDWSTVRRYEDESGETRAGMEDRVVTFLFDGDGPVPYVKKLTAYYGDPMGLLSRLILARNRGIIKQAHIGFRLRGTDDVLEENALSEGEYMLLVRLGLLTMGRGGGESSECLYLLDEPDVYLNERWNIDFVSMIHQICAGTGAEHELIVATHSSLILTDAFPEQLYYFFLQKGQVQCRSVQASTFGGSRNEIMQALFCTQHSVGSFSYARVEELLEREDRVEELERQLEHIGSGYLRLRLLDKIQRLRRE